MVDQSLEDYSAFKAEIGTQKNAFFATLNQQQALDYYNMGLSATFRDAFKYADGSAPVDPGKYDLRTGMLPYLQDNEKERYQRFMDSLSPEQKKDFQSLCEKQEEKRNMELREPRLARGLSLEEYFRGQEERIRRLEETTRAEPNFHRFSDEEERTKRLEEIWSHELDEPDSRPLKLEMPGDPNFAPFPRSPNSEHSIFRTRPDKAPVIAAQKAFEDVLRPDQMEAWTKMQDYLRGDTRYMSDYHDYQKALADLKSTLDPDQLKKFEAYERADEQYHDDFRKSIPMIAGIEREARDAPLFDKVFGLKGDKQGIENMLGDLARSVNPGAPVSSLFKLEERAEKIDERSEVSFDSSPSRLRV